MNEEELNLENILGGAHREAVEDKVLENQDLYRQQQIEALKKQKEALLESQEYNYSGNSRKGR